MRTSLILVLLALFGIAAVAVDVVAEEPTITAPSHPKAKKYTKRTITDTAVIDLCDLADVRECIVWNQTDAPIVVKYITTASDCTNVSIDTANDTDVVLVPVAATLTDVIGETSSGRDHTLCGKAASTVTSGNVYTIEAS